MDSASQRIADVFTDVEKIGEGTYGTVYKVRTRQDQELKALKQIKLNHGCEGVPSTCIREVCLLKELTHPNIVRLEDVMIHSKYLRFSYIFLKFDLEGKKLYLIFEFIDQDLKMLLERLAPRPLPVANVKSFIWQMLQALAYCHTHRVVHRDLKPHGTIKLADFGLARAFSLPSRCYTHEVVTLWYRAPEVLLGALYYSTAVDIWSLACIFAECLRNEPLFKGDSEIDQLFRIFQILGTPTSKIWAGVERFPDYKNNFPKWKRRDLRELVTILDEDGIELLKQMLVYPPMDRITAKLALSHRFLRDMPLKLHDITLLYNN
uniref:cyclin-dependent kinase n=1 Tax=Meloidogyne hapla TaxID=6305 RepID=A0A1I8B015_MELHA